MQVKFIKFVPLQNEDVTIILKGKYADIPELTTFLKKDVWLSAIQTEIPESRSAILMGIREMAVQVAEAIERELKITENGYYRDEDGVPTLRVKQNNGV